MISNTTLLENSKKGKHVQVEKEWPKNRSLWDTILLGGSVIVIVTDTDYVSPVLWMCSAPPEDSSR